MLALCPSVGAGKRMHAHVAAWVQLGAILRVSRFSKQGRAWDTCHAALMG